MVQSGFSLLLLSLLILLRQVLSETKPECPSFCRCYIFETFNRADCSSRHLANPNVEISQAVQILDLSYNDITILDSSSFSGLSYLGVLNVSHNALHTIQLGAFYTQLRMRLIDLSFNRLEQLDERTFESNHRLLSLNLESNKFMLQPKRRFLRSRFLQALNLRNSQLYFVDETMFSGLPKLRQLDLSANLLITVNMAAFRVLPNLRYLDLTGNRWMCNDKILLLQIEKLRQQHSDITLRFCELGQRTDNYLDDDYSDEDYSEAILALSTPTPSVQSQRFERMQLLGSATERENQSLAKWRGLEAIENSDDNYKWVLSNANDYDSVKEEDGDDEEYTMLPLSYRESCEAALHGLRIRCIKNVKDVREKLTRTFEQSESDLKMLYFAMGCVAGFGVFGFIAACVMCCGKALNKRTHPEPIEVACPPQSRRTRANRSRNSGAPKHTCVLAVDTSVRVNSDDERTFISGLFGKGPRYKPVVALIRSLSRNNLHRATESNDRPRSGSPPPPYKDEINVI